ncbi:MAG: acyltransferase [Mycolicibacterium rufum]|nr:acyltransferase [Mycolicibacterium rufum]
MKEAGLVKVSSNDEKGSLTEEARSFSKRLDRAARILPKLRRRAKGLRWHLWIAIWGGTVGRRLEVDSGARLRWPPHGGVNIGDDVYIGIGAVLDVPSGAKLQLADGVKIMHYSVLAASDCIAIGRDTQIAEASSVRDSDHGMSLHRPMKYQLQSAPVKIGYDVWIGRGVVVLKGCQIGDGAVIGANSVVRGEIPTMAIAVGSPAKVVRLRN